MIEKRNSTFKRKNFAVYLRCINPITKGKSKFD